MHSSNSPTLNQERLASIVQNSMDAIITVDDRERIVIFNTAAGQVFGYSAHQAMQMHLSELLPPQYRAAHQAHVKRFAGSGATSRRMGASATLYGLHANGQEFPLEASISRSADAQGAVLLTVILRDISARMKAQQELERARVQLRELSITSHTAREQEKARISRELHDELGQGLTALKMDLAWLQARAQT
jgi:two-component system, NarL family, sensor histidine kinase UhpB